MKESFWKWTKTFSMIGIAVASVFFIVEMLSGEYFPYPAFRLMEVLWPSSIFLLATDGSEKTLGTYFIVLVAILVNGFTYFVVGIVLRAGLRMSRRSIRGG
jgi:hypothetical protein